MSDLSRLELIALHNKVLDTIDTEGPATEVLAILDQINTGAKEQIEIDAHRVDNCHYCSGIPLFCFSEFTGKYDFPLPDAVISIMPETMQDRSSLKKEMFRCTQCDTPYQYSKSDHDDSELVLRLCIGEALKEYYLSIVRNKKLQPTPNQYLENVLHFADLGSDRILS